MPELHLQVVRTMASILATFISAMLLIIIAVPVLYWTILALFSVKPAMPVELSSRPTSRFIVAIPAHNEETVIARTVERLLQIDYPSDHYQVHVVADHCSDSTASIAQEAGALVHERSSGPRTGKGAALSWLLARVLQDPFSADAVVIFDADTVVDAKFLRVMDARLSTGSLAIQGQHIISNPEAGWFPSLTWAMFIIDNRFQNLGRTNLRWSAKNMGDSICFASSVLRESGWGQGLTEDYQLRQKLLLSGVRIDYEVEAKGYGEAPRTWSQAQAQRARWLRGTHDASQQFSGDLFRESIRQRNAMLLDGAFQAKLPSYSTLTMISASLLVLQALANNFLGSLFAWPVVAVWALVVFLLFLYPFLGLALERAPARAYFVILTGPLFVLWRTGLAMNSRLGRREVVWIRTAHGEQR